MYEERYRRAKNILSKVLSQPVCFLMRCCGVKVNDLVVVQLSAPTHHLHCSSSQLIVSCSWQLEKQ